MNKRPWFMNFKDNSELPCCTSEILWETKHTRAWPIPTSLPSIPRLQYGCSVSAVHTIVTKTQEIKLFVQENINKGNLKIKQQYRKKNNILKRFWYLFFGLLVCQHFLTIIFSGCIYQIFRSTCWSAC
jgi:hypothetical protein